MLLHEPSPFLEEQFALSKRWTKGEQDGWVTGSSDTSVENRSVNSLYITEYIHGKMMEKILYACFIDLISMS